MNSCWNGWNELKIWIKYDKIKNKQMEQVKKSL